MERKSIQTIRSAAVGQTTRRIAPVLATLAVLALTAAEARAAEFKLVANPDVSVDSLSVSACSRIFLKKQQRWADGTPVVPVDLASASPLRSSFSRQVHKRPTSAIEAYWQRLLFTGQGVPPVTLTSDAEVVSYVKKNPGAIGYVTTDAPATGLKVVELQ